MSLRRMPCPSCMLCRTSIIRDTMLALALLMAATLQLQLQSVVNC